MNYPGGKNAAGTYQRIINQIPPHAVYIEPFAGSAAIWRLLWILRMVPCPVMISGYWSELYNTILTGWRTDHFPQMTRGGFAIDEWLWMNYETPLALHDYRYLGKDFREREKFTRRRKRWTARLAKMAPLERQALLAALDEVDRPGAIAAKGDVGRPRRKGRCAMMAIIAETCDADRIAADSEAGSRRPLRNLPLLAVNGARQVSPRDRMGE